MIFDAILSLVIFFLLVERYVSEKANREEREKLLKMFMAKDLREVTDNEALEKIPEQQPEVSPDLVSMDDATEDVELFDRHVAAVKAQAKEELAQEMNTPI